MCNILKIVCDIKFEVTFLTHEPVTCICMLGNSRPLDIVLSCLSLYVCFRFKGNSNEVPESETDL